jgi:hypothetical protein
LRARHARAHPFPRAQRQLRSFVGRYLSGNPERISRIEAVTRFREIAPELSTFSFEAAAVASMERLDRVERSELLSWLAATARGLGSRIPAPEKISPEEDPTAVAAAAVFARVEREQPRVLDYVIGRDDLPMSGKLAVAGVAALGAQHILDR